MQLALHDVATIFNVPEKTIFRWIKQRGLPFHRTNEQYCFNRAELLEWATSAKVEVSPELICEPETPGAPLPLLHQALAEGGIHYQLEGRDMASVLETMVATIPLPPEVNRSFLLQVILAREALGSTGVGDGIAIPHVRNPIVLHVPKPMIALCFLKNPVDFGALDGLRVSVLFTLISSTVRAHLHLLSKLSHALRNPMFKEVLAAHAPPDVILNAAEKVEAKLSILATRARNGGQQTT